MPRPESSAEGLRWYLITAFVADCVEMLDDDKKLKLAHQAEQGGMTDSWQKDVSGEFGITKAFVKSVIKACQKCMSTEEGVCFLLRGLGCPNAESRVTELLGSFESPQE